ncbi:MAG: hypothetical protein MO853_01075 [Candidatus Protistobacter heckmanni]|nr:hypothetical protein [Candidatus Protistobacter heckmanni]
MVEKIFEVVREISAQGKADDLLNDPKVRTAYLGEWIEATHEKARLAPGFFIPAGAGFRR